MCDYTADGIVGFSLDVVNARDCGSYMPRPPLFKLSCDIRRKCCGRFSKFSNVAIKLEVI